MPVDEFKGWLKDGNTKKPVKAAALQTATTEAAVPKRPSPKRLSGTRARVKTPTRKMRVSTELAIVEADELIASHDRQGKVNPEFPAELQPRDRTRIASDAQIRSIQTDPDPDDLMQSQSTDSGAPIIGPDMVVESGNGRVIGLRGAYRLGNQAKYRKEVEALAADHDIDIAGMKQPVVVRVRTDENIDRAEFARQSNDPKVATMSATEQAQTDVARLGDTLEHFNPSEEGDLLAASNQSFIRAFHESVPVTELGSLITSDGQPSQALVNRMRNAAFYSAYRDTGELERLAEDPNPEAKNQMSAMLRAAPTFARARRTSEDAVQKLSDFTIGALQLARKGKQGDRRSALKLTVRRGRAIGHEGEPLACSLATSPERRADGRLPEGHGRGGWPARAGGRGRRHVRQSASPDAGVGIREYCVTRSVWEHTGVIEVRRDSRRGHEPQRATACARHETRGAVPATGMARLAAPLRQVQHLVHRHGRGHAV